MELLLEPQDLNDPALGAPRPQVQHDLRSAY